MYEGREVFSSTPLEYVVGEIKFPFAPQLGKDAAFEPLSASLHPFFPLLDREDRSQGVTISPGGMKRIDAHVLWRFSNRKRTTSIAITPTSLAVETTHYEEYQQFRTSLSLGLQAVAALNAIMGIERVGLRYINELRIPRQVHSPADWRGYVNKELLSSLSVLDGFAPISLESAIRLTTGPQRELTMKYASLTGSGVVGGGPLIRRSQPAEGPFFVLDIDSYWSGEGEEVPDFVAEQVLETFDTLHEPVGVLFLRLITEQFKTEVARRRE